LSSNVCITFDMMKAFNAVTESPCKGGTKRVEHFFVRPLQGRKNGVGTMTQGGDLRSYPELLCGVLSGHKSML
jgi:hypothetical protein